VDNNRDKNKGIQQNGNLSFFIPCYELKAVLFYIMHTDDFHAQNKAMISKLFVYSLQQVNTVYQIRLSFYSVAFLTLLKNLSS
jgi:hypothetical protein